MLHDSLLTLIISFLKMQLIQEGHSCKSENKSKYYRMMIGNWWRGTEVRTVLTSHSAKLK